MIARSTIPTGGVQPSKPHVVLRTIIALFDDTIDAEHALTTLRKSEQPPAGISVILRERVLDPDPSEQYQTVLSRVIASSALDAVSSWLEGLASLILPDRASYLVAGPIGAVLATIKDANPEDEPESGANYEIDDSSRQLSRALSAFGFSIDEAQYLEARVVAGSPLIAVTSDRASTLRTAHVTFSTFDAVHVGLARTEAAIHQTASRLLQTGPDGGGSVVIADAIAPLHRLGAESAWRHHAIDLRGREVLDRAGQLAGVIEDVLFEVSPSADGRIGPESATDRRGVTVRYLIVSFGGLLGMGKARVAIPAILAETGSWSVPVNVHREDLRRAPRFDGVRPLSRQDEVAICTWFDVPLYWLSDSPANDSPVTASP
jgi:hypothetical protein